MHRAQVVARHPQPGERVLGVARPQREVGDPEVEFCRVSLALQQQILIAGLRLIHEPLVVETPADELGEVRPGEADLGEIRIPVGQELAHPRRAVKPPAIHIYPEKPQMSISHPGVAPRFADPGQQVAGDAFVLFGFHLRRPRQVEMEHRGSEHIKVPCHVRPLAEVLLGLVAEAADGKRHARLEGGPEVAASVYREPGCVGVEVPLLRVRSAGQQAQGGRRERRCGQPPRANSSHPVSRRARPAPLSHRRPAQPTPAGTMMCFPVSAGCIRIFSGAGNEEAPCR